jgi:predicted phage-related endonuclease
MSGEKTLQEAFLTKVKFSHGDVFDAEFSRLIEQELSSRKVKVDHIFLLQKVQVASHHRKLGIPQ